MVALGSNPTGRACGSNPVGRAIGRGVAISSSGPGRAGGSGGSGVVRPPSRPAAVSSARSGTPGGGVTTLLGGGVPATREAGGGVCRAGAGLGGSATPDAALNAFTKLSAVGYRSSGRFASWRSTTPSTAAGISGRNSRSDGGGVLTWA